MTPVYNQVWEDFSVDREALRLTPGDSVLMIASAGCNVLNTALDGPDILAVDHSLAQLSLTKSKLAGAAKGHHKLWQEFGIPAQQRPGSIYTKGAYANFQWVRRFFYMVCGRNRVHALLESPSLAVQESVYRTEIEPRLWRAWVKLIPTAAAAVCGMHWRQVCSSAREGQFFLFRACRSRLARILTEHPIRANYFWHQMLSGAYSPEGLPPYLVEANYEALRHSLPRIRLQNTDLLSALTDAADQSFSAFNLLDVPDFVSPSMLEKIFLEVRRTARPGARVLFRSFAPAAPARMPDGFGKEEEASRSLSAKERTASYSAVHLYTVHK